MKTFKDFLTEGKIGVNKKTALKMYYDAGFDTDSKLKNAELSLMKITQSNKGYWLADDISRDIAKLKKSKITESLNTKGLGHSKDDLERMISKLIVVRKKNEKAVEDLMDKADNLVLSGKESNPLRGSLKGKLSKLSNDANDLKRQMNDLLDAYKDAK